MPEVDEERAEVIMYGLQNIIGELPKIFLIFIVAYLLGIMKLTLISFIVIVAYRSFSGGIHMKTHISCIIYTLSLYCGTALLGKYVIIEGMSKYMIGIACWVFCMIMIKLYAPADTENVPILRKKRKETKANIILYCFNSRIHYSINNKYTKCYNNYYHRRFYTNSNDYKNCV